MDFGKDYLSEDPSDTEEKRLSDLKDWVLANPTNKMISEVMEQFANTKFEEDDELKSFRLSCGLQTGGGSSTYHKKERPLRIQEIKWSKKTSSELLKALDRYQLDLIEMENKGYRPACEKKWRVVSAGVLNKSDMDPEKFAQSCKVHLANLNRTYRHQKRLAHDVDLLPEIRAMMDQYHDHVQQLRVLKRIRGKEVLRVESILEDRKNDHENPLDVLHAFQLSLPPRGKWTRTWTAPQEPKKEKGKRKLIVC